MRGAALELIALTKAYGTTVAVDRIDRYRRAVSLGEGYELECRASHSLGS